MKFRVFCWALAAAGWAADVGLAAAVPPNHHSIINGAAVCLTIWAMIITWVPRGRLIGKDRQSYFEILEAITRGVVAAGADREEGEQNRLTAVRPEDGQRRCPPA